MLTNTRDLRAFAKTVTPSAPLPPLVAAFTTLLSSNLAVFALYNTIAAAGHTATLTSAMLASTTLQNMSSQSNTTLLTTTTSLAKHILILLATSIINTADINAALSFIPLQATVRLLTPSATLPAPPLHYAITGYHIAECVGRNVLLQTPAVLGRLVALLGGGGIYGCAEKGWGGKMRTLLHATSLTNGSSTAVLSYLKAVGAATSEQRNHAGDGRGAVVKRGIEFCGTTKGVVTPTNVSGVAPGLGYKRACVTRQGEKAAEFVACITESLGRDRSSGLFLLLAGFSVLDEYCRYSHEAYGNLYSRLQASAGGRGGFTGGMVEDVCRVGVDAIRVAGVFEQLGEAVLEAAGASGDGLQEGQDEATVRLVVTLGERCEVLKILGCKCKEIVGELSAFISRVGLEQLVKKGFYEGGESGEGVVGRMLVDNILETFTSDEARASGCSSGLAFAKVVETLFEFLVDNFCVFSRKGARRLYGDVRVLVEWAAMYDKEYGGQLAESDCLDRAHAIVVVLNSDSEGGGEELDLCVELLVDLDVWVGMRADRGKGGTEGGDKLNVDQAWQILRENSVKYDKGVFAEILEPIMGKGLIPADPITWGILKRQIAQGFHKNWLNHRIGLFAYCNRALFTSLSSIATGETPTVNMEEKFNSVALDVIGKSVFNFEFDSVPKESPVIKAVYSALVEAGHRSMTPAPYWDIPGANAVVPRLRKFNADLDLLNGVLDDLISRAKNCNCLLRDTRQLRKCSRGRCSSSLVTLPS